MDCDDETMTKPSFLSYLASRPICSFVDIFRMADPGAGHAQKNKSNNKNNDKNNNKIKQIQKN